MEGGGSNPPQCYNEIKKPGAYRVKTKTSILQDLRIVWSVVLMFTNCLPDIDVFKNKTG